jgi:signal transduction histidine kinase
LSDIVRALADGPAAAVSDPLVVRANKLDLLERLSDALAHEIKNPLHSMVINLEVLKRRLARLPSGSGDVLRYATVLGEELERVNRRVELLLRLARPERGGPEEATLQEIVDELMELVLLEARHRGVRVEYRSTGPLARVRLGRQAARQIILDLVLDALESTDEGEVLGIEVRGGGGQVEVRIDGGSEPDGARTAIAAALAEAAGGRVEAAGGSRSLVLPAVGAD